MKRRTAHNSAPQTAGSAPLITSAEALRTVRQNKWNPLRSLTPDMLSRVLEQFDHGYLVEAVLLWEKIAERDDVIASVKPKREKDVSQLDMQVVADDGDEAAAHKDVLEDFWKNVRCVNSYDRNERGGFRRLVKQMMTAVSYRYAAHHIVWEPRADGTLRATFEFVPLWMFENRTGALRYLKSPSAQSGEILTDGEWMVTTGDGLMISCCIGYLAKRSAFNDWLIFSEKFSVPGVLGRTTGKKGSPEAEAMRAAVESFGHDWVAVIYGDDGTHQEPIKLVQAQGNPSAMPMPAVIERVDRKFAALYRGADLSSMSSGSGEGTGASLQDKETDILRRDDAEMIAETLEAISRMVIEWHFGHGVEPLARVELVVPVAEDASKVIENGLKLAGAGASVSVSALMQRAGLPEAKDPADRLGGEALSTKPEILNQEAAAHPSPLSPTSHASESLANSAAPLRPAWMEALSADLRPLGNALESAMQAGDMAAMQAALKKISAGMPEFMEATGFENYLQDQFTAALGGEEEEVANAARKTPARKWPAGSGGRGSGSKGGAFAPNDWRGYGLAPAAQIQAEQAFPPVRPQDAEARLKNGEAVISDGGEVVGFTQAILDHWRNDPITPPKPPQEIRRRLMELDDAKGAVEKPQEVWEIMTRTGPQRAYLRKYKGHGPDRWMAVFVPQGTGRTYFSSYSMNQADDSFRKGLLIRSR